MTTRDDFMSQLKKMGYVESEYGFMVHSGWPHNECIVVYDNTFARAVYLPDDDETVEYSTHTFAEIDLLRYLATDWNIAYYQDVEYHLSEIMAYQKIFRTDFANLTEKNIAIYKRHQALLRSSMNYSEICLKEGRFNV